MSKVSWSSRSLSVLLPVHNVQSSLADSVNEILDVLDDLTDRFELLIIDDGSIDATFDVARELGRRYPQVRVHREPVCTGGNQVVRRSLPRIKGDVIIAHDGEQRIDSRQIVRLWKSLDQTVPAPKSLRTAKRLGAFSREKTEGPLSQRLAPATLAQGNGGFQLLQLSRIEDIRQSVHAANEIAARQLLRTGGSRPSDSLGGRSTIDPPASSARRPNFLGRMKSRVRDFTLGE